MDKLIAVIIFGLASWRLASLLAREHGPWDVLDRVRYATGVRFDEASRAYGTNELSKGMLCIWCLSVWLGIAFVLIYLLLGDAMIWLAMPFSVSTIAIALDKVNGG